MKKIENKKKNWEKPTVTALSIKKETASGTTDSNSEDLFNKTPTGS